MSEEANTQQPEGGLSYGDISAAVQVVDVCVSRGAIKGDEMMQVGHLRERLIAFLRLAQQNGEEVGELPASAFNEQAPAQEEAPAEAAE